MRRFLLLGTLAIALTCAETIAQTCGEMTVTHTETTLVLPVPYHIGPVELEACPDLNLEIVGLTIPRGHDTGNSHVNGQLKRWPEIDPAFVLVHQLHWLPPELLRELARGQARREGLMG